MGTRTPHSILAHDLLSTEIKILFLKLTIALNLNSNFVRRNTAKRRKTTANEFNEYAGYLKKIVRRLIKY